MIAPFPPESAVESFLRIIPEFIQEPAVQKLGDLAGQLGLIVASIIALVLYGILGLVFLRIVLPRLSRSGLSVTLEGFLFLTLLFPGLFLDWSSLPIFGVSFFGITSVFATSNAIWLFPVSLCLFRTRVRVCDYYEFKQAGIVPQSAVLISDLCTQHAPEIVKSAERRKQSRADAVGDF